jgi:tRNA threonylcarbamoyladenosine biosynthesis protein TsaB
MGRLLCIETSTEICSVAIAENGQVIDFCEDLTGQNHSRLLTVYIDELLKRNSLTVSSFDAVAVGKGPGSYTGLRIGASVAKGLCYGAGIPLIAICPLEAMADAVIQRQKELGSDDISSSHFMPMIDARRMEVYTGLWAVNGQEELSVHARIIDETTQEELVNEGKIYFFGNGAQKCCNLLPSERFVFVDGIIASAKNMARLAEQAFADKHVEDVAYFEPHYLKEFLAVVGKNKVL